MRLLLRGPPDPLRPEEEEAEGIGDVVPAAGHRGHARLGEGLRGVLAPVVRESADAKVGVHGVRGDEVGLVAPVAQEKVRDADQPSRRLPLHDDVLRFPQRGSEDRMAPQVLETVEELAAAAGPHARGIGAAPMGEVDPIRGVDGEAVPVPLPHDEAEVPDAGVHADDPHLG